MQISNRKLALVVAGFYAISCFANAKRIDRILGNHTGVCRASVADLGTCRRMLSQRC